MNKKTIAGIAALGAVIGVATIAGVVTVNKKKQKQLTGKEPQHLSPQRNVYFAGGGISSLAGAFYLVHDCRIPGSSIHIFESSSTIGGAFNVAGDGETGYVCPVPKLLSLRNHPNMMDMLEKIPSVNLPNMSVKQEILSYMDSNPIKCSSRLVDKSGESLDSFTVSRQSLKTIKSLMKQRDDEISDVDIEYFFSSTPEFFDSNLWKLISTTYMLKSTSSALELKHVLACLSGELPELFTMENIVRSQYNLQETIIDALVKYLEAKNVNFATNCSILDVDFTEDGSKISAIHLDDNGTAKTFYLNDRDLCFITNGSISECASLGDYDCAPIASDEEPVSYGLWKNMISKKEGLGVADRFCSAGDTDIVSFTITARSSELIELIKQHTNEFLSSGTLITFADSSWGLTISCVPQPYFSSQSDDISVICGYGVNVSKMGDYIDKPMIISSGAEILFELVKHMGLEDRWEEINEDIINVIPCVMPYATASSLPYFGNEKPLIISDKNSNFAFIGQFAKLGCGISYSSEYATRTAREAAYRLTGTRKSSAVPPRATKANYIKMFYNLKKI